MPSIHPTAVVSAECTIADDAEIGANCVLEGPVILETGVRVMHNVTILGPARIGNGTLVYPGVCLGYPGQDVKFAPGDPTPGIEIGAACILREMVTVHAATKADAPTRVGNRVYMMVGSHVGHDGRVGDGVTMVNYSCIGGHGEIGPGALLGGGALVHQYGRVGRLGMISGGVAMAMDVPPFMTAGKRNRLAGLNAVGLRRSGMPREQITILRRVYREVFHTPPPRKQMIERLRGFADDCPPVLELIQFIETSRRSIAPGFGVPPIEIKPALAALRHGDLSLAEAGDDADVEA